MWIAHPRISVALFLCNYSQFSSQADNNFIVLSWKDSGTIRHTEWRAKIIFDSWKQGNTWNSEPPRYGNIHLISSQHKAFYFLPARTLLSEMCSSLPDYWMSKFKSRDNKNFIATTYAIHWRHWLCYRIMYYINHCVEVEHIAMINVSFKSRHCVEYLLSLTF